jgi:mannosyltransferase OCH1-like enzyme
MFQKTIWIYWEQGWTDAPTICQLCKKSWQKLNKTWKINVLDKNNISKFINVNEINNDFWNISPIQSRADIIRSLLLQKYGGVWVDATLICMKPLDKWLFNHFDINDNNDFFSFKKLYLKISISNWFLVSHPNNYIINKFTEKYTKFFKTNLVSQKYFQFHDDFKYLLKTDKLFFNHYSKNKKLSSNTARIFTCKFGLNRNLDIDNIIKIYDSPLYKLSHKVKLKIDKKTNISQLFQNIGINIKTFKNKEKKNTLKKINLLPIAIKTTNNNLVNSNKKNTKKSTKKNTKKSTKKNIKKKKNKKNKNKINHNINTGKIKIIKIKK